MPDADFDTAMHEVRRVLEAGSPLAVGLWGGSDHEGRKDDDEIHPQRFFSFRSHERVQEMLSRHGALEQFETWCPHGSGPWTYRWALLRVA